MKKIIITLKKLIVCSIILALFSCLTTYGSSTMEVPLEPLNINENAFINIKAIHENQSSIRENGYNFKPNDEDSTICVIDLQFTNNSEITIDNKIKNNLELLVIDSNGNSNFIPFTVPTNFSATTFEDLTKELEKSDILPGVTEKQQFYFIHKKEYKVAALVYSRKNVLNLLQEEDPQYQLVNTALTRETVIENTFAMAQIMQYEVLSKYITENNLDINVQNKNGINLLFTALAAENNSVAIGIIEEGIDIKQTVNWKYHKVEAIHMAVLFGNTKVIDALLSAGATLHDGGETIDEPAELCVRSNNLKSLKLLVENYNLDIKDLKITMNWSGDISAIKFAKDRGHDQMVQYLESFQ